MPRPRRETVFNADADEYRTALHEASELDRERQQVQRRHAAFNVDLGNRGVHPHAIKLGKQIMRIRDRERRRQAIDACAKVLIECDDDLMAEIGHNGPALEEPQQEAATVPFEQSRRTAAA